VLLWLSVPEGEPERARTSVSVCVCARAPSALFQMSRFKRVHECASPLGAVMRSWGAAGIPSVSNQLYTHCQDPDPDHTPTHVHTRAHKDAGAEL